MRLNATRPPEGAAAHLIGIHAIRLEADVRNVIRSAHNRRGNFRAAWVAGKASVKIHACLARHEQAIARDPGLRWSTPAERGLPRKNSSSRDMTILMGRPV